VVPRPTAARSARRSRIAKRREVRANLLLAADDLGAGKAMRNLGNSRRLAAEYRAAEFGDQERPLWLAAALFLFTGQLAWTSLLSEAALAFGHGVTTANPDATGTFSWSGIRYLQDSVTFTFDHGNGTHVGGAATPVTWALWLVTTILVGRLWRVVNLWRDRHATATT
jgi:hypothetical protein